MSGYIGYLLDVNTNQNIDNELEAVGVDERAIDILNKKSKIILLKVKAVPTPAANILKQDMLSLGGDVAVNKGSADFSVKTTDIIIMGNQKQYNLLYDKIKLCKYFDIDKIGELIYSLLNKKESKEIKCKKISLPIGLKTYIMGILNVTPDSFSDGGKYNTVEKALLRAKQMVSEGADIIDIGAVSTRPGFSDITVNEELDRLIPVVECLKNEIDVPISVDTFKPEVADEVLKYGIDMLNDQTGLTNEKMISIASKYNVPVVVMFNKNNHEYKDILEEHIYYFKSVIENAVNKGIMRDNIIIDPGFGFGKTPEQNLYVLKHLNIFKQFNLPILIGTSRKSMIGNVLDLPVNERLEGSLATIAYGIVNGADIVRVHDVKQSFRLAKMMDAIINV